MANKNLQKSQEKLADIREEFKESVKKRKSMASVVKAPVRPESDIPDSVLTGEADDDEQVGDISGFEGKSFKNPHERNTLSYLLEGLADYGMVGDEFRRGLEGSQRGVQFENDQLQEAINAIPDKADRLETLIQAGRFRDNPQLEEEARQSVKKLRAQEAIEAENLATERQRASEIYSEKMLDFKGKREEREANRIRQDFLLRKGLVKDEFTMAEAARKNAVAEKLNASQAGEKLYAAQTSIRKGGAKIKFGEMGAYRSSLKGNPSFGGAPEYFDRLVQEEGLIDTRAMADFLDNRFDSKFGIPENIMDKDGKVTPPREITQEMLEKEFEVKSLSDLEKGILKVQADRYNEIARRTYRNNVGIVYTHKNGISQNHLSGGEGTNFLNAPGYITKLFDTRNPGSSEVKQKFDDAEKLAHDLAIQEKQSIGVSIVTDLQNTRRKVNLYISSLRKVEEGAQATSEPRTAAGVPLRGQRDLADAAKNYKTLGQAQQDLARAKNALKSFRENIVEGEYGQEEYKSQQGRFQRILQLADQLPTVETLKKLEGIREQYEVQQERSLVEARKIGISKGTPSINFDKLSKTKRLEPEEERKEESNVKKAEIPVESAEAPDGDIHAGLGDTVAERQHLDKTREARKEGSSPSAVRKLAKAGEIETLEKAVTDLEKWKEVKTAIGRAVSAKDITPDQGKDLKKKIKTRSILYSTLGQLRAADKLRGFTVDQLDEHFATPEGVKALGELTEAIDTAKGLSVPLMLNLFGKLLEDFDDEKMAEQERAEVLINRVAKNYGLSPDKLPEAKKVLQKFIASMITPTTMVVPAPYYVGVDLASKIKATATEFYHKLFPETSEEGSQGLSTQTPDESPSFPIGNQPAR